MHQLLEGDNADPFADEYGWKAQGMSDNEPKPSSHQGYLLTTQAQEDRVLMLSALRLFNE